MIDCEVYLISQDKYKRRSLEERLAALSDQREKNINRYIIPIEIKMSELQEKIEKKKG